MPLYTFACASPHCGKEFEALMTVWLFGASKRVGFRDVECKICGRHGAVAKVTAAHVHRSGGTFGKHMPGPLKGQHFDSKEDRDRALRTLDPYGNQGIDMTPTDREPQPAPGVRADHAQRARAAVVPPTTPTSGLGRRRLGPGKGWGAQLDAMPERPVTEEQQAAEAAILDHLATVWPRAARRGEIIADLQLPALIVNKALRCSARVERRMHSRYALSETEAAARGLRPRGKRGRPAANRAKAALAAAGEAP